MMKEMEKINQILERFGEEKRKSLLDLCAKERKKRSLTAEDTHHLFHTECTWYRTRKKSHLKNVSFSSLHGIYGSTQPYRGFSESG